MVAEAANDVSDNAQAAATGVDEMGISIKEIARSANDAAMVATSAVDVANKTNATVEKLGASSVDIGKIIAVITSIAEQTNLPLSTQPLRRRVRVIRAKASQLLRTKLKSRERDRQCNR